MEIIVRIQSIKYLTHDVLQIVAEKPVGLHYKAGQAVDISINKEGWEKELRPFTFTSLPEDNFVEFTIKTYPNHKGVTNELRSLKVGDEIIIHEVFGDIEYKGPGIFMAGGAGVTPFIAIFKQLEKENKIKNNKLIFANKKKEDIILENRFNTLLGKNFINVLSEENLSGYENGYVNEMLLKKHTEDVNTLYYLCGPEPMMQVVERHLSSLGVSDTSIVKEAF